LLSKISFGSFLIYAPRGTNDLSNKAKQFVRALKEERPIGMPPQSPSGYAARRLADERAKGIWTRSSARLLCLFRFREAVVPSKVESGPRTTSPPRSSREELEPLFFLALNA